MKRSMVWLLYGLGGYEVVLIPEYPAHRKYPRRLPAPAVDAL